MQRNYHEGHGVPSNELRIITLIGTFYVMLDCVNVILRLNNLKSVKIRVNTLSFYLKFKSMSLIKLLIIAFFVMFHVSLEACDDVTWQTKEPILIYTELWPPYQELDYNGNLSGIATTQIKSALNKAGVPYRIIQTPWARAMYTIENQKNTLIFSISRTPPREKKYAWLHKIGRERTFLVALKDSKIKLNTLHDALRYRIGLKRDDATNEYFENLGFNEKRNLVYVSSSVQALSLIKKGRIDFYPVTESSFRSNMRNRAFKKDQFEFIYELPQFNVDLYLATSINSDKQFIDKITSLFACYQGEF